MMGYVTRHAAPTPKLPEKDRARINAISTARMAENVAKKKAAFVKNLSPADLARYKALDPMAQEIVALNGKMPCVEKNLPVSNYEKKLAGALKRNKNKKDSITLEQIVAAVSASGQREFTANSLYHILQPARGNKATRKALALYADEGKMIARHCGAVTRYSLAVES